MEITEPITQGLNEFIYHKILLYNKIDLIFDEKDIEKWIIDWYNGSFTTPINSNREPPLWLADWRRHEK